MGSSKPVIFISYSHKDAEWLEFVQSHLQVGVANDHFETWDDRHIAGGADWAKEIDDALDRCAAFILLVSRYSLTSNFILKKEVQAALEARWKRGVRIYPIIVRDIDIKAVPWLASMNVRPRDAKALGLFPPARREQVMKEIAKEIRELVQAPPTPLAASPGIAAGQAAAPAPGGAPTGHTANFRGDGNVVIQNSGSGNTISVNGRK
jgi:TIR domain